MRTADELRKLAAQRSRARFGPLTAIPVLCAACRHEYDEAARGERQCPECGQVSQTGADLAKREQRP